VCGVIALALLTLAVPIQFSGHRITVVWAIEAAVLGWIAVRGDFRRLADLAMVVFALVLARLCFIDAWMYGGAADYRTAWNPRFLTFAAAAVSMWLTARRPPEAWRRISVDMAGHAVMLVALVLEVLGWAARVAAPENLSSVRSASVSILLAGYALLLVSIGVATSYRVNRLLGLGLVAVVVGKLYLHDVWQLRRIYRVTAFAVLGLLLLLMSFLYSRYRGSIEGWWKKERVAPEREA
jgi:uncharacterized membrane protein